MISRRHLLQTAGAAGALAGFGLPRLVRAQSAAGQLTPGVEDVPRHVLAHRPQAKKRDSHITPSFRRRERFMRHRPVIPVIATPRMK